MTPSIPSNAQDYYKRGRDYHREANYDRAISDYTQAIALNPNYTDAYAWRAVAYFEKGDYRRTIANWTIVIGLDFNRFYGYIGRGGAYLMKRIMTVPSKTIL